MQFKVVLFISGSVTVMPPGVVQGELSTKGQAQFCDSFNRMVCWTCLGVLRVSVPEAFWDVLSRFRKVSKALDVTPAQFRIRKVAKGVTGSSQGPAEVWGKVWIQGSVSSLRCCQFLM